MLWDLEIMLVKVLNWPLADIDRTDCTSLFEFLRRIGAPKPEKRVFADEVDW